MSRPSRIEFCGALYHVTARGDRREAIYEDDADRHRFLALLAEVVERFNWRCHGYCLMTNHYHLLIETSDGNLSKGMRQLNGVYTQASNRRPRPWLSWWAGILIGIRRWPPPMRRECIHTSSSFGVQIGQKSV